MSGDLPITSIPTSEVFANKDATITVNPILVEDMGLMFCIEVWATVGIGGQDERLIQLYIDPDQMAALKAAT